MRRLASRVRSPLPTLRALRDEARAAVEAHDGDTGEAGNPADLARFSQLCRVLSQREGAVARAEAADSALEAAAASGQDVWYIGYNKDMAQEFINDCAKWARAARLSRPARTRPVWAPIRRRGL